MRAVVAMQDKGGALGALPVARELVARGHDVRIIVCPESAAATVLSGPHNDANLPYEIHHAVPEQALKGNPDVLVVAMDPFPKLGGHLVSLAKGTIPVIALTDTHGGALTTGWGKPGEPVPDYVVVNDNLGAEMVIQAWPEFPPANIWATGFPALDRLAGIDIMAHKASVRKTLNLDYNPIVLFGDAGESSAHAFLELVRALNHVGTKANLIPRLRPDTPQQLPDELRMYWAACEEYRSGRIVFGSHITETIQLIAAADVTVSSYSTMLQEAAALHRPNIAVLYEPQLTAFHRAYPVHMPEPTIVTLGCARKAVDPDSLIRAIKEVFYSTLELWPAQKQHFKLDGKNTSRVVDRILTLL